MIPSLNHDALPCRRRNPPKECQRYRQHKTARACDNQKNQPPVNPCVPVPIRKCHGRVYHNRKRAQQHRRRIKPGKGADEILAFRLLLLGFFYHPQNSGDSRIFIRSYYHGLNRRTQVNITAVNPVSRSHRPGSRLSCQRLGIYIRYPVCYHGVRRHTLPRLDDNRMSRLQSGRVYLKLLAADQPGGILWTDID